MNEQPMNLRTRVEQELDRAGLPVVVELDENRLVITGLVSTEVERASVIEIAESIVGDSLELDDNIAVTDVLPEETDDATLSQVEVAGIPGAEPDTIEQESVDVGDFTDQDTAPSFDQVQAANLSETDERIWQGRRDARCRRGQRGLRAPHRSRLRRGGLCRKRGALLDGGHRGRPVERWHPRR